MARRFLEVLDCAQYRKVFVAADIHGEFLKFDRALYDVGFSAQTDLVIAIGDLVDRGPNSEGFEYYLDKSWFKRVLGNHDEQPREFLLGFESRENVANNGGEWFLSKSPDEMERIAALLEDAPLALELLTPYGHTVGITHADVHHRWDWLRDQINDPDLERYLVNMLVGSRKVIDQIKENPTIDPNKIEVRGIDHVFHGHTPIDKPLTVANRTWIDTGACDGGSLTIIDIDAHLKER